jgi:hypothetical protein
MPKLQPHIEIVADQIRPIRSIVRNAMIEPTSHRPRE